MRQGASGLRICLHNAAMPRSSQILAHAAGALPAPGEWQSARSVPLLANLQRLTAPNPGFMTGPGTNSYLVGDAATGYFVIDPGPADGEHIARLWDAARHADGSGGHIQAIVCTHSHADHSPGAAPLQALCTQRSGHTPPIWGLPSAPTARANSHFVPDQVLAHGALLQLQAEGAPQHTLMALHGHVPLPPYIKHDDSADDVSRYQTVFAKNPGAVAAPTAALHFDEALLGAIEAMGVTRAHVTLHVGAGTFQPVKTENLAEHQMHSEWYDVPLATQIAIAECKARGGRVVAVGTTTVRTLESWAQSGQTSGDTQIFITPGFEFKLIDLLITNFHLSKSSLMMLVSAFAGYEHIMALYRQAIAQEYRFFSYGDAMLLTRQAG